MGDGRWELGGRMKQMGYKITWCSRGEFLSFYIGREHLSSTYLFDHVSNSRPLDFFQYDVHQSLQKGYKCLRPPHRKPQKGKKKKKLISFIKLNPCNGGGSGQRREVTGKEHGGVSVRVAEGHSDGVGGLRCRASPRCSGRRGGLGGR